MILGRIDHPDVRSYAARTHGSNSVAHGRLNTSLMEAKQSRQISSFLDDARVVSQQREAGGSRLCGEREYEAASARTIKLDLSIFGP